MSYWLIKSKEEDKFFNGFNGFTSPLGIPMPHWSYQALDGVFKAVIFNCTKDKVIKFIRENELNAEPFYLNKG